MSKIFLAVGHGGSDPGAVNGSRFEKNDTLALALKTREKLLAQGHEVRLSRETDVAMTPAQRRQMAKDWGADILIDLHRNSVADSTARGIEIWVRYGKYAAAAAAVLERLAEVPNQGVRGVKTGAYAVLLEAGMPAMLIELGFISNTKDNELFDRHLDGNATAIARGVLDALGEEYREPGGAVETPLYRVQVGAFRVKENAEQFLQTVRDMGLQAFLVAPDAARDRE